MRTREEVIKDMLELDEAFDYEKAKYRKLLLPGKFSSIMFQFISDCYTIKIHRLTEELQRINRKLESFKYT